VFVDRTAPPAERFKSVWVGHITRAEFEAFARNRPNGWEPRALFLLGEKDEVTCLKGSLSADGIRWTTLADPLVVEYCDTLNTAYYDTVLRKYVIYTRERGWGAHAHAIAQIDQRIAGRAAIIDHHVANLKQPFALGLPGFYRTGMCEGGDSNDGHSARPRRLRHFHGQRIAPRVGNHDHQVARGNRIGFQKRAGISREAFGAAERLLVDHVAARQAARPIIKLDRHRL
jgi:hypothetical protein